jgi:hypothetical protein
VYVKISGSEPEWFENTGAYVMRYVRAHARARAHLPVCVCVCARARVQVNGSEREWFEDAGEVPKDRPWVQSWHQWRGAQLRPYKDRAPPPCAPRGGRPPPPQR